MDDASDVLIGPGDHRKEAFGVTSKKITKTRRPAPERTLIRSLADGPTPGSMAVKWKPQFACAYEIQWSTDPTFATINGSTTSTRSKLTLSGLNLDTQFWIRIRASTTGPWSDVATRTAGCASKKNSQPT